MRDSERPFSNKSIRVKTAIALTVVCLVISLSHNANAKRVPLIDRVNATLRANRNFNGASAYTTTPGTIVLHGKVFNEQDRDQAEKAVKAVPGVKAVINTLLTTTGQWFEQEVRLNDTLRLNGLDAVSVRVIGNQAYLSGQVTSDADKQRAATVVSALASLQINNFIRVVPGAVFSTSIF